MLAISKVPSDLRFLPPKIILETAVERARAGRYRVGWQGANRSDTRGIARICNAASVPEGGLIGCVVPLPKRGEREPSHECQYPCGFREEN